MRQARDGQGIDRLPDLHEEVLEKAAMLQQTAVPPSRWAVRRGIIARIANAPKEQPMKPDQSSQNEPSPREKIPPEILEWARQTFDEQEFLKQVREMEATGGLRLEDFIAELEARARSK
jgi:hypothetical protein